MVTVLEDSFRKSLSQHLHSHYFQMISILCKVLRSDSMLWSVLCCCLVTKSCLTLLQPHGLSPTTLLCPWNFPGKNTGVSCHSLLQGIFLTGTEPTSRSLFFTGLFPFISNFMWSFFLSPLTFCLSGVWKCLLLGSHHCTEEDVTGAAKTLLLLQCTYKLDLKALSRGVLPGKQLALVPFVNICFRAAFLAFRTCNFFPVVLEKYRGRSYFLPFSHLMLLWGALRTLDLSWEFRR